MNNNFVHVAVVAAAATTLSHECLERGMDGRLFSHMNEL